jgi:Icc protein
MRIVHLSDLHWEAEPERLYPGVGRVLEASRRLVSDEGPDFVLVTGDLTCRGSAEVAELRGAKAWLDSLGVPYLCIPGNHDLGANPWRGARYPEWEAYDGRPLAETAFGTVFGVPPLQVKDLGPVLVVGLTLRAGDPDQVLSSLAAVLDRADKPILLAAHYPLQVVREQGILAEFGFSDFIPDLVDPLRRLIADHPVVRLYLAGHIHAVSAKALAPHCLQITAGALGPGASAFRRYQIAEGALSFSTRLGAGPLGFWERLIPEGVYDPHYHLGRPDEREGVWPLK